MSQVCDGLPNYVLVVYVDILHCGVLRELAKFNRTTDSAFTSVYAPSTKTISSLAAFPGGEAIYKTKPPTKLTFLSGDNHHNNKIRKLHLAVDTESLGKNLPRVGSPTFFCPRFMVPSPFFQKVKN